MSNAFFPEEIQNWVSNRAQSASSGQQFEKISPINSKRLCTVARSGAKDVAAAVEAAKSAQPSWAETSPVERGLLLHNIVLELKRQQERIAQIVAAETGKSYKDAYGEVEGAINVGLFYVGEGQRLYGRTTTSAITNRHAMTTRQPVGVAGLITAANTPIANVAWKTFPALICGNAAVLKAAEDAPVTAWIFGRIACEAGLPPGVLNVLQGYGDEAGALLVAHPDVDVISFTGSTAVGRKVAVTAGERLAKVSLELGGKNPLVVCDDADLQRAADWALLSAFSNAGQRCASASRIIIFDAIYDTFRNMLLERTKKLKIGPTDEDDFGPVINERQLQKMLGAVERARRNGAVVLTGGCRLTDPDHRHGFYMAPTLLEHVNAKDEVSTMELFGPIACLYRVQDFEEALRLANDSPYGLTACIHTHSLDRAMEFSQRAQAGVTVVNGGTYGSEPHMPFGGLKQSGNGSREPGPEALDVYSELKDVYIHVEPERLYARRP